MMSNDMSFDAVDGILLSRFDDESDEDDTSGEPCDCVDASVCEQFGKQNGEDEDVRHQLGRQNSVPHHGTSDDETNSVTGCSANEDANGCKRVFNKLSKKCWGLPILKRVPESDHDRAFDCLAAAVSLFLCIGEVGSEIKLLYEYYTTGQVVVFSLMVGVIVTTSFIVGIFTIAWTLIDQRGKHTTEGEEEENERQVPLHNNTARSDNQPPKNNSLSRKLLVICRNIASFLQFGKAFRLAEYIYNMWQGWKSTRKDERRIRKAEKKLRDAYILGLMEGYLETTPKFLLQLYLRFDTDYETWTRDLFLGIALASVSVSTTACYMGMRKCNHGRHSVTVQAWAVYFLMRLFELGPRLILLVLCAELITWWTLLVVGLHIMLMMAFNRFYVHPENIDMCHRRCGHYLFPLFLSYVEIYSFINMNKTDSRRTATIYYTIFYLENALMTSLVLGLTYGRDLPCVSSCLFVYSVFPGAFFHILLIYIYYTYIHSTRNREDN
ncbi:XK-related protein 6-like isoform X2 [Argopecten irradians]